MFPPYTINISEATTQNGWNDTGVKLTSRIWGAFMSSYKYDKYGLIPTAVNGSEGTYIPNKVYSEGNSGFGGGGSPGVGTGIGAGLTQFSSTFNHPGNTSVSFSLAYKQVPN